MDATGRLGHRQAGPDDQPLQVGREFKSTTPIASLRTNRNLTLCGGSPVVEISLCKGSERVSNNLQTL